MQFLIRIWRRHKNSPLLPIPANYAAILDSVLDDREEVIITRAGRDPVVLVALDDYESLKETAYLLRSPTNARHLLGASERREAGNGVVHSIDE